MKLLILRFCIFQALVAPLANAGVRSVGDGGGFAELQFVYDFKNSKNLINYCLNPEFGCQLTSEQKVVWKKLLVQVDEIVGRFEIGFVTESKASWAISGNKLLVNANKLYQNTDQQIPESEILALAVAIQLSFVPGHNQSFDDLLSQTNKAFQGLRFVNKKISSPSHDIYFHQLKMTTLKQNLMVFALEDFKSSYLLNEMILQSYPTILLNYLTFSQMDSGFYGNSAMYFGFASGKFQNGDAFTNKKIRIQVAVDSESKIISESIKIELALE